METPKQEISQKIDIPNIPSLFLVGPFPPSLFISLLEWCYHILHFVKLFLLIFESMHLHIDGVIVTGFHYSYLQFFLQ